MTRVFKYAGWFLLIVVLAACASTDNPPMDNDDDGNPVDTLACSNAANYTMTFNATWSAQTHPEEFPVNNPHFSGLIGAIHNGDVSFWKTGELSSAGIKSMAETGSKGALTTEVNAAITTGTADAVLSGGGIGTSPDDVSLSFDLTEDFSQVTLVSMIAPSPDWFVGVSGLELCEGGNWVNSKTVNLFAYDAGTDSGESFTSGNQATTPPEAIRRLTTGLFEVNGEVPPFGTFEFKRN